ARRLREQREARLHERALQVEVVGGERVRGVLRERPADPQEQHQHRVLDHRKPHQPEKKSSIASAALLRASSNAFTKLASMSNETLPVATLNLSRIGVNRMLTSPFAESEPPSDAENVPTNVSTLAVNWPDTETPPWNLNVSVAEIVAP